MKNKKLIISEDFKEILINEGIDPLNVVNFTTENDKNKKIITTITLIDGTEHKIIDNFVWYAARKKTIL
jgi:hypothetical protein